MLLRSQKGLIIVYLKKWTVEEMTGIIDVGSGTLDIILRKKGTDDTERGIIFTPTVGDALRIHDFLKDGLPKDKSLEYSFDEISYLLGIGSSIVSCLSNSENIVVGITIAYPAHILPVAAKKENWSQEGGFSEGLFSRTSIYSELRALASAYRSNGLGDVLRSKQILEVAQKGYDKIILYSVPGAYPNNINFGCKDQGLVKLVYGDGKTSDTYLMTIDLTEEMKVKASDILRRSMI